MILEPSLFHQKTRSLTTAKSEIQLNSLINSLKVLLAILILNLVFLDKIFYYKNLHLKKKTTDSADCHICLIQSQKLAFW